MRSVQIVLFEHFSVRHTRREARCIVPSSSYHLHNVGEVVLVTQGNSLIDCDGTITRVRAPYVVYYPAGMPHMQDNSTNEAYERWCFQLFLADIAGAAELPDKHFVIQLNAAQCELLTQYVRILYSFWGRENKSIPKESALTEPHDRDRLKYLLLLFLGELQPLIPDTVFAKSSYINDVCLYIGENLHKRLTIDSLAERFFVCRATLTRDFRCALGMSVVEFITTARVDLAKRLLREEIPLSVIAEKCGFSSVSYFVKVFARHAGRSPADFRAALANRRAMRMHE